MMDSSSELAVHAATWFTAWSALRSYPSRVGEGYFAAQRLDRNGDWEYFSANPTPAEFSAIAAKVTASSQRAFSVIAPDIHRYVALAHKHGLGMVSTSERLMVCAMETQDNQDPFLSDPELTVVVKQHGGRHSSSACQARFSAAIMHGQTVVASGRFGVHGEYAVFDGLTTNPAYRRRGFGMLMMKTITARALDYPVTTGLVMATAAGQELYYKLGWRSLSPVTVLVPRERLEQMARM